MRSVSDDDASAEGLGAKSTADAEPETPANARYERAVIARLTTSTIKEAAEQAGVHERTLRKWMADPAFIAMFNAARRQNFAQQMTRLVGACTEATDALERILKEDEVPQAAAKVAAARAILEYARGFETDEIAEGMRLLREQLEGGRP